MSVRISTARGTDPAPLSKFRYFLQSSFFSLGALSEAPTLHPERMRSRTSGGRSGGCHNPAFREPFILNAIDPEDQLLTVDDGRLLKTAAFRRSRQREDRAPYLW